jgi:predicted RNA binding protein YcfA (HicA-like mRNA interferase family)
MGRLAGFKYRQIVKKLKRLGFEFDRQAAGSHEIWYNPSTNPSVKAPKQRRHFPMINSSHKLEQYLPLSWSVSMRRKPQSGSALRGLRYLAGMIISRVGTDHRLYNYAGLTLL